MLKLIAANRFLARLLAGVMITAAVVALALESALSRSQAFM
jgi:hypothetical protein